MVPLGANDRIESVGRGRVQERNRLKLNRATISTGPPGILNTLNHRYLSALATAAAFYLNAKIETMCYFYSLKYCHSISSIKMIYAVRKCWISMLLRNSDPHPGTKQHIPNIIKTRSSRIAGAGDRNRNLISCSLELGAYDEQKTRSERAEPHEGTLISSTFAGEWTTCCQPERKSGRQQFPLSSPQAWGQWLALLPRRYHLPVRTR